jgi:hypothetical protein
VYPVSKFLNGVPDLAAVPPDDPATSPAEPDAEAWFESDEPPPEVPRRSLMRLALLLAVLVMAVGLMARLSAGATFLLFHGRTQECGDIGQRAALRAADAATLPPLEHGSWCHLKGVVAYPTLIATGEENPKADSLSERNRGQKYITQLEGDRVFLIVAADRVDVINHVVEFRNLFGFHVEEHGRIIDPDLDPRFAEVGPTLRKRFEIPNDAPLRLFDTTDEPLGNWFVGLALVVVAFIAVRSVFSAITLVRDLQAGRRTRKAIEANLT